MSVDAQAREFRDVAVDIDGRTYRYYMTDDMRLLSAELEKHGYLPPPQAAWWRNPHLAQSVRDRMSELRVCYSLCLEAGVLNYFAAGSPLIIHLRYITDPKKYVVMLKTQYLDFIGVCLRVNRNKRILKNTLQKVMDFCGRMNSGMELIQEFYGLKDPENLTKMLGKSGKQLEEEKIVVNKSETFPDLLRRFRDERKLRDVELYRAANLSKQTYHNIISGKVVPTRESAFALSFALKLDLSDTERLLSSAGHSFLPMDSFTRIVKECILLGNDLQKANSKLDEAGLPILGNAIK